MATVRGAKALGMEKRIGRLAPGFAPDFCVFDVPPRRPLQALLDQDGAPREVWIGGKKTTPDPFQAAAP